MLKPFALALASAAVLTVAAPMAEPAAAQAKKPVDIADVVSGIYHGDVVADTRGGSQSGVEITVRRVSKNLVEVSSDYARVPTVQIALTAAAGAIIAARPGDGFLYDPQRERDRLDLSIDGVTLIVRR